MWPSFGASSRRIFLSTILLVLFFDLTEAQFSSATYDDSKARDIFFRLYYSMALTPDTCYTSKYPDWKTFRTVTSGGSVIYGTTFCHIVVNEAQRQIQINFRGAPNYSHFSSTAANGVMIDFMVLTHEAAKEKYRVTQGNDVTATNPKNFNIFACPTIATYTAVPSGRACYRHCCYPVKYVGTSISKRCTNEEDTSCGGGLSSPDGWSFGTTNTNYGTESCP